MSSTTGWAVLAAGGRIYINSVSETRRASIVNWLEAEKHCVITNRHSDEDIEKMWRHFGEYVNCRKVSIEDLGPVK